MDVGRMTALRSERYLAGSRGAPCTLRIASVCRNETDTVVPCHLRDKHTGRSIKASDLSVADGCQRCHDVLDRRARLPNGMLLSDEEWLFYALRGLQETLERRRELKLLTVVGAEDDKPRVEAKVKPRLPKSARRSVGPSRPMQSDPRPIPSRPFQRKEKA